MKIVEIFCSGVDISTIIKMVLSINIKSVYAFSDPDKFKYNLKSFRWCHQIPLTSILPLNPLDDQLLK